MEHICLPLKSAINGSFQPLLLFITSIDGLDAAVVAAVVVISAVVILLVVGASVVGASVAVVGLMVVTILLFFRQLSLSRPSFLHR